MIGIIDGGNFYKRCVYSAQAVSKFVDKRILYDRFSQCLDEILSVNNSPKIVMALDAKTTWRKSMFNSYKSDRKEDKTINWDIVTDAKKLFTQHLIACNCVVSYANELEADDIIAKWVKSVNESFVIYSADQDLNQLLYVDTKNFCIQVDLINRKIFIPKETKNNSTYTQFVLKTKDIFNLDLCIVEPNLVVLEKVLMGDKPDSINSVYTVKKETKSGAKNYGFANAKFKKVFDGLNIVPKDYKFTESNFKSKLLNLVLKELDENATPFEVEMNYENNVKLIYLNENVYPFHIKNNLDKLDLTVKTFEHGKFKSIDAAKIINEQKGFNSAYWNKYLDLEQYIKR